MAEFAEVKFLSLGVGGLTATFLPCLSGSDVVHDGAPVVVQQQERARVEARPHAAVASSLADDGDQQDRGRYVQLLN